MIFCCLRYCKSTIFQANHNLRACSRLCRHVVCDTAKVRFFKQITTATAHVYRPCRLFAILQKYDFSSKSQLSSYSSLFSSSCLRYCKSTIFQANHNTSPLFSYIARVVCDTAKVRFFKQITTLTRTHLSSRLLFAILQKYDFSSKSQLRRMSNWIIPRCLRYCKSTIFQANHNRNCSATSKLAVVCDTAKVRFFKQITTEDCAQPAYIRLFAILQKYDFSSKSQR